VNYASITIRQSVPSDSDAIERVAQLDSGRAPGGRALVALEGGEVRAVLPLDGGHALADPFHHTAELVELLQVAAEPPRRRRERVARRVRFGLRRPAVVSGA
jgi:hypothetical protein